MNQKTATADRSRWLAIAAAGVTVVLWASAFVAIRSTGHDFAPGALALGRLVVGALALGIVCVARHQGWPPRAAWPGILVSGVLWFGGYMVALGADAAVALQSREGAPAAADFRGELVAADGVLRTAAGIGAHGRHRIDAPSQARASYLQGVLSRTFGSACTFMHGTPRVFAAE